MDQTLKAFLDNSITEMVRIFNNSTPPQTLLEQKKFRAKESGKAYLTVLAENAEYLHSKWNVHLEFLNTVIYAFPQQISDLQANQFFENKLAPVKNDIATRKLRFSVLEKYSNLSEDNKRVAMEKEYIRLAMTAAVLNEITSMVRRDNNLLSACNANRIELKSYLTSRFPLEINNNLVVQYNK